MKRKILIVTLILSGFCLSGYSQVDAVKLDNEKGSSMIPIIYELDTLVNIIEKQFEAEIVRMEFDIIKDTAFSYRTLFPGYRYGVFVYGDYRIKEIDLAIYEQTETGWSYVSSGSIDKNTSIGWIEPEKPGMYSVKIFVKEFLEGFRGAHYGILIFN
ncbi:hypothetical protein ACFLRZ_00750 [Bacteroidota bacterium]